MMEFNIKHVFSNVSHITNQLVLSNTVYKGSTWWRLALHKNSDNSLRINLVGGLRSEDPNKSNFIAQFGYNIVVKSYDEKIEDFTYGEIQMVCRRIDLLSLQGVEHQLAKELYAFEAEDIEPMGEAEHLLRSDKLDIQANVKIFRLERIPSHVQELNFKENINNFKECDVIIKTKHNICYAHSQILSLHSTYFAHKIEKAINNHQSNTGYLNNHEKIQLYVNIEESSLASLLPQFFEIMYTANRSLLKTFEIQSFLFLAEMFDSRIVTNCCEDYLLNIGEILRLTKQYKAILAWRFGLEMLKMKLLNDLTQCDFRKIQDSEDYHLLSPEIKLEMWEALTNKPN